MAGTPLFLTNGSGSDLEEGEKKQEKKSRRTMTLTKKELEAINTGLQRELERAKAEVVALKHETHRLRRLFGKNRKQWIKLRERYRHLHDYIAMLREWVS